jgi:hypothetical protein
MVEDLVYVELRDELAGERLRVIRPSGLVEEPADVVQVQRASEATGRG